MKTAMQELIEILEDKNHLSNPRNNQDDIDTYLHCIDEAKKLLQKEKEQSINLIKQTCMFMGASIIDIEISKMEFIDIYNNYYNQKQHIIDIMKADEDDGLYNEKK
jgi:hypothetical protein